MMHAFELRVRYGDTDPMGWVYYGNYLRWFEVGRAEMIRSLGRSYATIEREDGILLPVLEARCQYFHGARYDELVSIQSGVLERGRASLTFGYRIVGEDGARCAIGLTRHCCTDRDAKLVRPPAELASLLDGAPRVPEELAKEILR